MEHGQAIARPSPERADARVQARPSLQALLHGWVVLFGLLSLAVAIALIVTSTLLQRATNAAMRDVATVTRASRVEVELLKYQRYLTLLDHAPAAEYQEAYEAAALSLERLLPEAVELATTEPEAELWQAVAVDVDGVLREGRSGGSSRQRAWRTRDRVDRAIGNLDRLRAVGQAGALGAFHQADRLDRLSNGAGAAAGALLLLGLAAVLFGGRRYMVRPLQQLGAAIHRFRAGETQVQIPEPGSSEMAEVANAFEDLVDALVRSREIQLAFLAGVAHDLRNPLSALKMAAQVMGAEVSEAQRTRTVALMDRQIDRLARMVDDLLDATRIEAGRLELQVARFDLRDAARDMVRLYGPTAPRHEIVLRVPDEPLTIEGDSLRIEQVISNLVSNAIKYAPDGGRVDVVVRELDACPVVEVSDRGIGIPAEQVPELFMPFRRRARDVAPGAGLGLSVVHHIVSAHGGRIEVESRPGRGSTFRVLLPRSPAAP